MDSPQIRPSSSTMPAASSAIHIAADDDRAADDLNQTPQHCRFIKNADVNDNQGNLGMVVPAPVHRRHSVQRSVTCCGSMGARRMAADSCTFRTSSFVSLGTPEQPQQHHHRRGARPSHTFHHLRPSSHPPCLQGPQPQELVSPSPGVTAATFSSSRRVVSSRLAAHPSLMPVGHHWTTHPAAQQAGDSSSSTSLSLSITSAGCPASSAWQMSRQGSGHDPMDVTSTPFACTGRGYQMGTDGHPLIPTWHNGVAAAVGTAAAADSAAPSAAATAAGRVVQLAGSVGYEIQGTVRDTSFTWDGAGQTERVGGCLSRSDVMPQDAERRCSTRYRSGLQGLSAVPAVSQAGRTAGIWGEQVLPHWQHQQPGVVGPNQQLLNRACQLDATVEGLAVNPQQLQHTDQQRQHAQMVMFPSPAQSISTASALHSGLLGLGCRDALPPAPEQTPPSDWVQPRHLDDSIMLEADIDRELQRLLQLRETLLANHQHVSPNAAVRDATRAVPAGQVTASLEEHHSPPMHFIEGQQRAFCVEPAVRLHQLHAGAAAVAGAFSTAGQQLTGVGAALPCAGDSNGMASSHQASSSLADLSSSQGLGGVCSSTSKQAVLAIKLQQLHAMQQVQQNLQQQLLQLLPMND